MKLLEFGRATERGSVSGCGWAHRRALTLNNYTYCTETSNQIKYQFTDVHTISFFRSLHILQCHLQHPSSHQPLPTKTHPPLHHKPHSPSKTPPHPLSPKPPSSDSPPTPLPPPLPGKEGSSRIDESPLLNCVESSRSFPFFFSQGGGAEFWFA
ncbi:hypothetical protein F5882DRAFT_17847 [Hyaloscypha sp. PMI_1271]|nr:hypothetical protein F5882DRAFT_17847 [Hyaloscypha sp. PMI_1271]